MVLIILLPMGRHWRLLSFGERTTGIVQEYKRVKKQDLFGEFHLAEASEVHFIVADTLVKAQGPYDLELEPKKSITVFYQSSDPAESCLFHFGCLYMTSYSILPLILIFVWWAFYLSFNNYHRDKKEKSHTPASSPYKPFQGGGSKKGPSGPRSIP